MVGKSDHMTVAQQHRIDSVKEFCGCLPCLLDGLLDCHADYHHVLSGGRRISHSHGYGNCPWHHRGLCWENLNSNQMTEQLGPSMSMNRREYKNRYGSEERLLSTQNFMLCLLSVTPWQSFVTPPGIAEQVRAYWRIYPSKIAA